MKNVIASHSYPASGASDAPSYFGQGAAASREGDLPIRRVPHLRRRDIDNALGAINRAAAPRIAVIDGPYNAVALSNVLAREPVNLGHAICGVRPNSACVHGTFIVGLLTARGDAPFPGLCPTCDVIHIALFADENVTQTSVVDLALAINSAVAAGASIINLSLAIVSEDRRPNGALTIALDRAEAAGVVVVAAAGNQGRSTASQILSHSVTIPVVAVDAGGNLLPDCNFGPLISRKGVAAYGYQVRGYAPDGSATAMSGTSVATAVATGIVARAWSARPNANGAYIRAALANLPRREARAPPRLSVEVLLARLDHILASRSTAARIALQSGESNRLGSKGGSAMNDGNGPPRVFARALASSDSYDAVAPAVGSDGCACGGASNGSCTCTNGGATPPRFVYVLGTVDCRFPDQSVSDEFQAVAETIGIKKANEIGMKQGDQEPMRTWVHRVLTDDPTKPGPRHIARQLCWVLTVEKQPAYYLTLRDWQDLDDLIACLGEPDGDDVTLLIGSSSLIPVETCPGVVAPVLQVEQVCAYKLNQFVSWCDVAAPPIEKRAPKKASSATPTPTAESLSNSLFRRVVQAADNFGDTDQSRALNYLAVRYKPLYHLYVEKVGSGEYFLDGVRVLQSRLSRERRIVDPVFCFVQKSTGTLEKYFCRVDVTWIFPFMVNHIEFDGDGRAIPNYFDR